MQTILTRSFFVAAAVAGSLMVTTAAQAGVAAYSGLSGEKLFIEAAPKLGADAHVVKFEGPSSAWAGKLIKTTLQQRPSANRYVFNYEKKRGSKKTTEEYQIIVDDGFELINGTRVKKVKLYFPEANSKPVELNWDDALTKSSQSIDLTGQYGKTPFTPEIK